MLLHLHNNCHESTPVMYLIVYFLLDNENTIRITYLYQQLINFATFYTETRLSACDV